CRKVLSIRGLGMRIERPDLHAGDALLEQRLRQLVGAMQEGLEVLVGPLRLAVESPVPGVLSAGGADVAVARARVVGAYPFAARAAEQLIERLLADLAVKVPQREVESRGGARL